jgi:glutathione S-transferase
VAARYIAHANPTKGPPLRLYDYAASGNCYKARLLLALLHEPYERVPVDIFAGETLTDAFAHLNAARETPVLQLDDGETILQSNAILWYLGEGTAYLPDDPVGRARVVQWLSFEQEWIMRGVGSARFWMLTGRNPDAVAARQALGRQALDMLDAHLSTRPFVVADAPSIADVSLFAYTHVAPDAGIDLAGWPAVQRWIARMEDVPGFVDDYVRYPENARPGRGHSIYD